MPAKIPAPVNILTQTTVPTPTEAPAPAEVPQAVDSSSVTNNYAITSYEPATASPTDSLQAPDTTATVTDTTIQKPDSIATTDTTQSKTEAVATADTTQTKPDTIATADTTQTKPDTVATADTTQTKPDTVATADTTQTKPNTIATADTTQTKPDTVATADTTQTKPVLKEEKTVEQKPTQNKPKRFWGGITAGITYNDYFSTKFGLNDLKSGKDYNLSVSGADDLLSNFWGVGFKAGMSCMFIASPYFNLRSDLNIALRQGSGKTNASIILDWKDSEKADEKSNLEIEYSATQLNIDLPFLARISIPKAVYFEAGPMFSFNVYSKSESEITDIYGTEKFEEKGGLNAFEFDLAVGIGISRSIGKSMLDFDLRFVFGMTRISDANDAPKTWQGQLNITYWFL